MTAYFQVYQSAFDDIQSLLNNEGLNHQSYLPLIDVFYCKNLKLFTFEGHDLRKINDWDATRYDTDNSHCCKPVIVYYLASYKPQVSGWFFSRNKPEDHQWCFYYLDGEWRCFE